jgi:hypothetical protein
LQRVGPVSQPLYLAACRGFASLLCTEALHAGWESSASPRAAGLLDTPKHSIFWGGIEGAPWCIWRPWCHPRAVQALAASVGRQRSVGRVADRRKQCASILQAPPTGRCLGSCAFTLGRVQPFNKVDVTSMLARCWSSFAGALQDAIGELGGQWVVLGSFGQFWVVCSTVFHVQAASPGVLFRRPPPAVAGRRSVAVRMRLLTVSTGAGVPPAVSVPACTARVKRLERVLATRHSGIASQHDARRCDAMSRSDLPQPALHPGPPPARSKLLRRDAP